MSVSGTNTQRTALRRLEASLSNVSVTVAENQSSVSSYDGRVTSLENITDDHDTQINDVTHKTGIIERTINPTNSVCSITEVKSGHECHMEYYVDPGTQACMCVTSSMTPAKQARVYVDTNDGILMTHTDTSNDNNDNVTFWMNTDFLYYARNNSTLLQISQDRITSPLPWRGSGGSVNTPTYSFTEKPDTGMTYDSAASSLILSNQGSPRISITPSTTIVNGDLSSAGTLTILSGGSGSAPNLRFSTSSNTGMFFASSNLNIVLAASTRILITTSNTQFTNPILAQNGSVTGAGYAFTSATNTGMYLTGSGASSSLSLAVNGTQRLLMDNSNNVLQGNTLRAGSNGTAGTPWYTFNVEPTMGMYRIETNTLGFSCGGAERLRLTNTGVQIGPNGTLASNVLYGRTEEKTVTADGGTQNWTVTHNLNVIKTKLIVQATVEWVAGEWTNLILGFTRQNNNEILFHALNNHPTVVSTLAINYSLTVIP